MKHKLRIGDKVQWHDDPNWEGVVIDILKGNTWPYYVRWDKSPHGLPVLPKYHMGMHLHYVPYLTVTSITILI